MKTIINNRFLTCVLLSSGFIALPAHNVYAQTELKSQPLSVEAGVVFNDNLNPTLTNEVDGKGVLFSPYGTLFSKFEGGVVALDYEATYEKYQIDDGDNFDDSFFDYRLNAITRLYLNPAFYTDISALLEQNQQKYGEGISRFQDDVLITDELTRKEVSVGGTYGRDPQQRFVSLSVAKRDDSYDNPQREEVLFDASTTTAELSLGFAISNSTRLLFKGQWQDTDFDSPQRSDGNVYSALFGFDYQFSGKSRVTMLLGAFRHEFDNLEDDTGTSWSFSYEYSPYSDETFMVTSSRSSMAADSAIAEQKIEDVYSVQWNRRLNDIWSFNAHLSHEKEEVVSSLSRFTVDQNAFKAGVIYALSSYNSIVLNYGFRDVEASNGTLDYKQNEVNLLWLLTL